MTESPFCTTCSSFFHTPSTCPTQQPPPYTPINNTAPYRSQAVSNEWHYRSLFASGIPHDKTPSCAKHTAMRLQIIGQLPHTYAEVPLIKDAFRDDFVATRTLLPLCRDCLVREAGVEVPGLDQCMCATKIATAACSQCVIAEINGTFKFASKKRSTNPEDPGALIRCTCGELVQEDAEKIQARQCVYCKGVVTAAFRNYAGADLVYASAGAGMPHVFAERQGLEEQSLRMEDVDSLLEGSHDGFNGLEEQAQLLEDIDTPFEGGYEGSDGSENFESLW